MQENDKLWLITRSFEEDDAVWWVAVAPNPEQAVRRTVEEIRSDPEPDDDFRWPESWFVYAFEPKKSAGDFRNIQIDMFADDPEEVYVVD